VASASGDLGVADGMVSVAIGDWGEVTATATDSFSWFALTPAGDVAFTVDPASGALRALEARGRGPGAAVGRLGDRPVSVEVLPG
jgi:hypothetical protein